MATTYTVHGVLAGAYKSKSASMLYHASVDGELALCGKVKAGHLADSHWFTGESEVTCAACARKTAGMALALELVAEATAVWAGEGEMPVSRFMVEVK